MRRLIPVLYGLGAFLLVAGLVALLWAPGVVKKTPLDVNSTTRLSGTAEKLNTSTGELETNPVRATSITKSDADISDGDVVVMTNSTCLLIDRDDPPNCVDASDDRLVSASTDVFATDRKTALAVNDDKYLPEDATDHEGLINKWPFDAEKKAYPYWDGTVGEAIPARYTRTVELRGIETYVYRIESDGASIEIAEGVPGTYDSVKEIYVEPRTGAIVNQTDDQQRYLEDGDKVLDLQLAFTDEQVKTSVDEAQDNISSLNLITRTVPLVGIIAGVIVLAVAVVMTVLNRRRVEPSDTVDRHEPAGV